MGCFGSDLDYPCTGLIIAANSFFQKCSFLGQHQRL